MKSLLLRFFSPDRIVKEEIRRGEIPSFRNAYRSLFMIAGPAIIEMVFISLIGTVDMVMVGALGGELGKRGIAAVGLTNQPRMIFMAVFFALNAGVTAIVARRKGQGEQKDANLCLMQGLLITGILSVFLSIVAFFVAEPLMWFAGAEADTIQFATEFFQIVAGTLFIPAITMSITGAQRGTGNTMIALVVNIIANTVNAGIDYLLVTGNLGFPRLEVKGDAIATAIGNAVGLIIAIISISHKNGYLSFHQFGKIRFDKQMLLLIRSIGGNAMLEQFCLRAGFFLFALVVAKLGTSFFAAHQIGLQMLSLTFTVGDGISVACTSLVGQNLGRKRPDLSYMYAKLGQRVGLIFAAFLLVFIIVFRRFFVGLFTDEASLIGLSATIMIFVAIAQPAQILQLVTGGSLRGAGDTGYVAKTMLFTIGLLRPLLSAVLVYLVGVGVLGAWITICVDQFVRYIMLNRRLDRGEWMKIVV